MSAELVQLMKIVLAILVVATAVGWILEKVVRGESGRATVRNANERIRAWWIMCGIFGLALLGGKGGALLLFAAVSTLALREFLRLVAQSPGDRSNGWLYWLILPLQYCLLGIEWYGLFAVMIPVYAFLVLPARSAMSGDTRRFLERVAEQQWGLMVCVYCVSHAPALLTLHIPGYEGKSAALLFYLILVVQISDVFQYLWGKCLGRRKVAPEVSPNKTWEGLVGGVLSATLLGTLLYRVTPFAAWQACLLSLLITGMGFLGGLTMSAIKRGSGIKDYGSIIEGHGGILDRIDSICFAAPVFFHVVRFFFTV